VHSTHLALLTQRRCHPEEALHLPTFNHLLIVNKLLSLSLSLSLSLALSLLTRRMICASFSGTNTPSSPTPTPFFRHSVAGRDIGLFMGLFTGLFSL
jgi:hypothetical protein